MIANAKDPIGRIQTLLYLLHMRYEADPDEAGKTLRKEPPSNTLCATLMAELHKELESSSTDLGFGTLLSDHDARSYLKEVLRSYRGD